MKKWISVGVLVALIATIAPSPASAQAGAPLVLTDGPWVGSMSIYGNAAGVIEGASVDMQFDLNGTFDIVIGSQFTPNDESAVSGLDEYVIESGSWAFDGTSHLDVPLPELGGRGTADWVLDAGGGFEGTVAAPVHTGTVSSSGITVTTIPEGTYEVAIPLSTTPMSFDVELESATCNEAYGDFSISLAQILQDQGLSTYLEGPWVAYKDTSAIEAAIEAWRDGMRGITGDGATAPSSQGVPEIVRLFGQLLAQFNNWVDSYQAATTAVSEKALWTQTANMINDQALFLARLRNLQECDAELIDPELLQKFETVIKQAMLTQIGVLVTNRGLNAGQLTTVTNLAVNAGALGASGPEPLASETEEILRKATEDIIVDNLVLGSEDGTGVDGLDATDPEVVKALALGASMNWNFTLNGNQKSAATIWSNYNAAVAAGGGN